MTDLKKAPFIAKQEIEGLLSDLLQIRAAYEPRENNLIHFELWRKRAQTTLDSIFFESSIGEDFLVETKIFLNKFSAADNAAKYSESLNRGEFFLRHLLERLAANEYLPEQRVIAAFEKNTAITIIRTVLTNFHQHIKAMYQDEVHGNAKIKKEVLDKIQIGNEYDVQRILYSLIKPIFPNTRLEVADDAGYSSVRYDIVLDEYELVIEVKCTRPNMTERKLTEELGADSFHYKADHLFLFIFDKAGVIKNPQAFTKSFKREKPSFGKELEAIIIQETIL